MSNRLGKTIRILRQAKAMKLSDMAKASGVSVPFLSLVETGDRQPSLDVLGRIASSLGVPQDALIMMGVNNESLVSSDKASVELSVTVGRLMEIESKLRQLLNTEVSGATKRRRTTTHRGGDGPRPR